MGDHLAESGNPLALPMTVQSPDAASAAPTGHLLLMIHGLCMNDLQWRSENKAGHSHDHGEILAARSAPTGFICATTRAAISRRTAGIWRNCCSTRWTPGRCK